MNTMKSFPVLSSHDRILLSAKQLFARNGYENTSTVAIARQAGTSESQLMKHFGSKQGLLTAIFDHGWETIAERVKAVNSGMAPCDRLFAILEAVTAELERDVELKDLMMLEACRVRKDNTEVLTSQGFRQFAEVLDGVLTDMRNDGQLRPDVNRDAVRAAYVGLVEGMIREQVVVRRAGQHPSYGFEDIRKVLEILVPAFADVAPQPMRAVQ